jgi:F-type H+-transporting ATPase subunit epsilon
MVHTVTFSCAIVTPEGLAFQGEVNFVALPAHDGEIGILRSRAPLLCKLGIGILRLAVGSERRAWLVDGGFAQMVDDDLTVLTAHAYPPDKLDRAQAEQELDQALAMKITDDASARSRDEALARARVKIKLTRPR